MLRKKTVTLLKNLYHATKTDNSSKNKKIFQTNKKTTIKPIKAEKDKHISDRLKHTSIHVKRAV